MTRTLLDLSHPITPGMQTYPGLPGPQLRTHVSREQSARRLTGGLSFEILGLDMVANTGTYLDAPRHYWADGADVAGLELERLVDVPVTLLVAEGDGAVGAGLVEAAGDLAGRAVLVCTGWSRHWGTDAYASGGPHLSAAAVDALVERSPALVGIDALNIDAVDDPARPAHARLLRAGIPIVEHLTGLEALVGADARLTVLPPPFAELGTFPVRAVAVVA
ncbi:kynurenine formamidase [Motilibacter peucedani]|uniref:Kynurenine formamidase n=1 Tax=Motilibacter peucedani TaxID=598650 RepID=A0A420XSH6_9ACTN|nr:cyclase family protein [Motilibacter peucedani]RKS77826.1 kynurenine formamidase [Motilibacter peucedani]